MESVFAALTGEPFVSFEALPPSTDQLYFIVIIGGQEPEAVPLLNYLLL